MGRQRRHHLQAVRLRHVLFPPVEVEDQGARVRLVRYEFRSDFGLLALLLFEANLSVGNSLDVLVEKAELPRNQVEELLDGHLFPPADCSHSLAAGPSGPEYPAFPSLRYNL